LGENAFLGEHNFYFYYLF